MSRERAAIWLKAELLDSVEAMFSICSPWASEGNGAGGAAGCARAIASNWLLIRGSVVRQERVDQPAMWLASLNAGYLGEYLDREEAKARVEADIEHHMSLVLEDWALFQAARRTGQKCAGGSLTT